MTYNITSQDSEKIVFERESQTFSNSMKIIGVIGVGAWILLLLATGFNTFTIAILVGLFMYMGWVVYQDQTDIEAAPRCYKFLSNTQLIHIEMDDKSVGYLPYCDINGFDIEVEQRSPVNANSVGVNYIHYHVNVLRKNKGIWTITSSTKRHESEEVLRCLRQQVKLPASEMVIQPAKPSTVKISGSNPVEIWWSKHQVLFVSNEELTFENHEKKIKREFPLLDFIRLSYSYSDAQESNSIIMFYFRQGADELAFKMNTPLNPAECLNLEFMISQIIQKKLSA